MAQQPTAEIVTKVGKEARDKVYLQVSDDRFGHIEIGSCKVDDEGKREAFRVLTAALNCHAGRAQERDELLEALTLLRDDVAKLKWGQTYPGRNHAIMDRVDALIAKAEGRS